MTGVGERGGGGCPCLKKVLTANGYKKWVFKLPKKKEKKESENTEQANTKKKYPVGLPYVKGLSETLRVQTTWYPNYLP